VTNSTISDNRADLDGGGISNNDNLGNTVTLTNVTITGNTADADENGDGNGGGIHNNDGIAPSNVIELANTIVAGNIDGSAGAESPDCEAPAGGGGVHSVGNNLVGDIVGCVDQNFDAVAKNDQLGDSTGSGVIDPLLAALTPASGGDPANGSPAGVHVPKNGSPVIDAVDATIAAAPADDQRGTSRPQGPDADIGAVEAACGDGEVQGAEECDDGDTTSGDGCSATCETEGGGTTGGTTGGTGGDGGGGCSLIR
jgi:cysteine-rich repeat protein